MSVEITKEIMDKFYNDERMTTGGSYVNVWSTAEPKYDVFIIFNEPVGIVPKEKLDKIADLVRPVIEKENLLGKQNADIEKAVDAYLEACDEEACLEYGFEVIVR